MWEHMTPRFNITRGVMLNKVKHLLNRGDEILRLAQNENTT